MADEPWPQCVSDITHVLNSDGTGTLVVNYNDGMSTSICMGSVTPAANDLRDGCTGQSLIASSISTMTHSERQEIVNLLFGGMSKKQITDMLVAAAAAHAQQAEHDPYCNCAECLQDCEGRY